MTREEFIDYLDSIGAIYIDMAEPMRTLLHNLATPEMVYIYDKQLKMLKDKYPVKYHNLYVPYLRVSEFDDIDGNGWYTRYDGDCQYMPQSIILDIVRELTGTD